MAFTSALRTEAQTIPNAGFETWTNFGSYSDPAGWSSINVYSASTGTFNTEQGSPGSAGASFLKLTVKDIFGDLQSAMVFSTPAWPTGQSIPGFPLSSRPADLTGKYQYKSTGADTMLIQVILTKWNTSTMSADIIGIGANFMLNDSVTSWTSFSIPISYFDGTVPDSAIIALVAGSGNLSTRVLNDYLYIDELAFSGIVAGVEELENSLKMSIAPNPFSTYTRVTFTEEQKNVNVTLMNILGKRVRSFTFTGTELILAKDELPQGIYLLNITDKKNSFTRKIVIE